MYNREEKNLPNFTLIKNSFDAIDLRKDGVIDMNEWCKAFASYNGKLDYKKEVVSNGLEFYDKKFKLNNNFKNPSKISHYRKILRDWETSGDISFLYKFINKNRKLIKEKITKCNFIIVLDGIQLINSDNLISVLKDIIPGIRLSQTQWKMIVNVAQNERTDGLINIHDFFKLLEITSLNMASHPITKKKKKVNNSINEYSGFNCNNVGYKSMYNGFGYNKRSNSINKDPKNFKELSYLYGNPFTYALPYTKRGVSSYKTSRLSAII
jgi:Ca2+-binding EF-hand superfamily protein